MGNDNPFTGEMFQTVPFEETIPIGWSVAAVNDVILHQQESRDAITSEWSVYMLSDGKISGSGDNYGVQSGDFPGLAYKLLIRGKTPHRESSRLACNTLRKNKSVIKYKGG